MSSTTFWVLSWAPAVYVESRRVVSQRRGDKLAYLERLAFRGLLSGLVFELYLSIVLKFWHLSASNDLDSIERVFRYSFSGYHFIGL